MAKWIECGDWGQAFIQVIPKRKGGMLKGNDPQGSATEDGRGEEIDDGAEEAPEDDGTLAEDDAASPEAS